MEIEIVEGKAAKGKRIRKEEHQLIWFIVVVVVVFASFLGPYFYVESLKKFDYMGASWTIEKFEKVEFYHGRFQVLHGAAVMYNLYLRNDPRENDVPVEGTFDSFEKDTYISFDRESNNCHGMIAVTTLADFLRNGGSKKGEVESATSDLDLSSETGLPYQDCYNSPKRTIVMLSKGEENKVTQSEENPYCYTIEFNDCDDYRSIEKFIIEVLRAYETVE